MHTILRFLFPFWFLFLTFAEGTNGASSSGDENGDDDKDKDAGDGDNGEDDGDDEGEADVKDLQAEIARMKAALRKANKEAKERRLKLQGYEEAEKKRQDKDLSELEKAKKGLEEVTAERDTLQSEKTDLLIRHAIALKALELGFNDAQDAHNLIDLEDVSIDPDTDEVSGVEAALKALAKAKPYLLKAGETDSGGTPRTKDKKLSKGKLSEAPMVYM